MSFFLRDVRKRYTGMRRLPVTITIFFACFSSYVEAACEAEVNNAYLIGQRIGREWPLRFPQDNKTQYVQRIADSLVRTIKSRFHTRYFNWPLQSWKFLLVRDLSVNAYSIGNGRVYLTDGTLDFVKNEAELLAIIAHELAHQLLGHFCQFDSGQSVHRLGSLVQIIDHKKEMEADALAVEILQKANFPAHAMLDIVKKLPALNSDMALKQKRINGLRYLLQGVPVTPFTSSYEFLQIKKSPFLD